MPRPGADVGGLVGRHQALLDQHEQVRPLAEEIEFLLEESSTYLAKAPQRQDVLSTFAGLRPLVKSGAT